MYTGVKTRDRIQKLMERFFHLLTGKLDKLLTNEETFYFPKFLKMFFHFYGENNGKKHLNQSLLQ